MSLPPAQIKFYSHPTQAMAHKAYIFTHRVKLLFEIATLLFSDSCMAVFFLYPYSMLPKHPKLRVNAGSIFQKISHILVAGPFQRLQRHNSFENLRLRAEPADISFLMFSTVVNRNKILTVLINVLIIIQHLFLNVFNQLYNIQKLLEHYITNYATLPTN